MRKDKKTRQVVDEVQKLASCTKQQRDLGRVVSVFVVDILLCRAEGLRLKN